MAALMGGMCLQKSLGAAHAMATPLGELHLHHGTLIGILLPHVLEFNADHAEAAIKDLSDAMGANDIPLHEFVARLVAGVGLPANLSTLDVRESQLPGIAEKASKDHLSATNPRPASAEDYRNLLGRAL